MTDDLCPASERDDGAHIWTFVADDPFIVCPWCREERDAATGEVLVEGRAPIVHRIKLPWQSPPIHANQRLHRRARDRKIADVRRDAGWLVKAARIGTHQRVTVGLEWRPKVRRRRDGAENLTLIKPLIDGLVDAGVVPDDTPEHVERRMPALLPVGEGEPGMWLVVETP